MRIIIAAAAATLTFALSGAAQAAGPQIAPLSYSAPGWNGYADTGDVELTDGIIADRHYPSYSPAGDPYVGWLYSNPSISFDFGTSRNFDSLVVWVDDYRGSYGVTRPAGVSAVIGGVTYSNFTFGTPLDAGFSYPIGYPTGSFEGGGTPMILDLAGASGSSVTVDVAAGGAWTFLSEVQFFAPSVPEPATWAMMLGGFGLMGASLRRRRGVSAIAGA